MSTQKYIENSFAGTTTLYLATLKQSLKSVLPWILAVILLSASSYAAYNRVFPTAVDQQNLNVAVQSNPAFNLIFGSADSLLSAEGFTAWRSVVLGSFLLSMMTILLVAKHTRAKEDSGEAELIASSVVGRYTLIIVALGVAITACIAAAMLLSVTLLALGADNQFAVSFGLTIGSAGILFATVSALVAQIVSYNRTVISISVAILGFSYLLRGIADTVDAASWMSNLSPLGWAQQTNLAEKITYVPLTYFLLSSVLIMVIALIFKSQRDFGQGLIADKPGKSRAKKLSSINGVALRLHKNALLGWTFAFVCIGTAFGYLLDSAGSTLSSNQGLARFIDASNSSEFNFVFQFAVTLLTILGIIAAVYGTQIIFRLYNEEMAYRSDPLLAGSVNRNRLFLSHVQLSILGPISAIVMTASLIMLTIFINDTGVSLIDILFQAFLTLPAVLLLVGIAIATIGVNPKLRGLAWLAIALSFGLTLLGPILNLNKNILAISPFWHVASANDPNISLFSTLVMIVIFIGLIIIGFMGYKRRDIAIS
jgi:ABC-2 type transport system permease protein